MDGGTNDADMTADGVVTLREVNPGTYTVTETKAPEGYLLPAERSQEVVLVVDQTGVVTFQDPIAWKPLTVTKTAAGTYDVAYTWAITKDAAAEQFLVAGDGKATVGYTVTVTEGERTESNWMVSGSVRVDNPNAGAVTATIADPMWTGMAP